MTSNQLSLQDLSVRSIPPVPWAEGDNIPWNDPAFSERMLREHLSQSHDLASRRSAIVEAHVRFIHTEILGGRSERILDLGCGPGLYLHRLARIGHQCDGIDFGPASIRYAREVSDREQLGCRFLESDLRNAELGTGYGLVMMLYGQFNVFRRAEARNLLEHSHAALAPAGRLLLEVQTEEFLSSARDASPTWYTSEDDVFSDRPHLTLFERFWDERMRCGTERWYVVDLGFGSVMRYALSCEAYSVQQLSTLLQEVGFTCIEAFPLLKGSPQDSNMFAIVASKR